MTDEQSKCNDCIHYITSGVLNNDIMHPIYKFECELKCINCDEHFEEDA